MMGHESLKMILERYYSYIKNYERDDGHSFMEKVYEPSLEAVDVKADSDKKSKNLIFITDISKQYHKKGSPKDLLPLFLKHKLVEFMSLMRQRVSGAMQNRQCRTELTRTARLLLELRCG